MQLIGAGLPRTGTLTQKEALELLGVGPCYHWVNLITDPDAVSMWHRAVDGEDVFEEIFGGYQATVDWPGGFFYRELAERYPDAKVLLSVREPRSGSTATGKRSGTSRAGTPWSATCPTPAAK